MPVWLPFAVLGVAAVYLGLRWDEIPPTWTTHWDIAGRPNGWSHHDLAGVFGPLIIGALILAFMEGIGRVTRLRRSSEAYALEAVRDATLFFVRTMALGLSLVFALLAVDLPLGPRVPHALLGALLLGVMMGALALGKVRMAAAFAAARRAGHGAAVEGWHSFYYANRSDGRLWVPKLSGLGWTVNFANPWAWLVTALLVGVPLAWAAAGAMGSR